MGDPNLTGDRCTLTVRVPISIRKRGRPERSCSLLTSRHVATAPAATSTRHGQGGRPIISVSGLLEHGAHASVAEVAGRRRMDADCWILNLSVMAPPLMNVAVDGDLSGEFRHIYSFESDNVMFSPVRYMYTHQRLEKLAVVRHPQMHKLMRDHEILEAKFLISQIFGQRNDARR
jgi:hypothetical protein